LDIITTSNFLTNITDTDEIQLAVQSEIYAIAISCKRKHTVKAELITKQVLVSKPFGKNQIMCTCNNSCKCCFKQNCLL